MKIAMKKPNLKHDLLLYSQEPLLGKIRDKKKYSRLYKYVSDHDINNDQLVAEFLRLDPARFIKLRDIPNSPVHKIVKFVKKHPCSFFGSIIAVSYIEDGDTYGAHYVVGYDGHRKLIRNKKSRNSCVVLINSEETARWTINRFHQYCKKPRDTILLAKKLDPQRLTGLKAYLDETETIRSSTHDNEVKVRMRQPNVQESIGRHSGRTDGAQKALMPQNLAPRFPTSTDRQSSSYETPRMGFFNNQHDAPLYSAPQKHNGTTSKAGATTFQSVASHVSEMAAHGPTSTTFDAHQITDGYEKPRQFAAVIDDKPIITGTTRENPLFYRLNNESQEIPAVATAKQDEPIQTVRVETSTYETPRQFAAIDRMDPIHNSTPLNSHGNLLNNKPHVASAVETVPITPAVIDVKPNAAHSKHESTVIQQLPSSSPNRDLSGEKTESEATNGYSFLNNYKPPPANTSSKEKPFPIVSNGGVTDDEKHSEKHNHQLKDVVSTNHLQSSFDSSKSVDSDYQTLDVTNCVNELGLPEQIVNDNVKPSEPPIYTVVVAGSTGGGKSTLLNNIYCMQQNGTFNNALENKENSLLLPVRIEEGVNNKLHIFEYGMRENANEEFSVGKSTTQRPKDYIVDYGAYKMRFVDTPGTNDTRGDEQDRTNVKYIQDHLAGLDEVHGILFVIKTDDSKLSPDFRRTMNMLLELLPRKALNNCCFVYTFSAITSHFTPGPARQAVQAFFNEFCEKHRLPELQLTDSNQYCVDNEAFRYIVVHHKGGGLNDVEKYKTIWDKTAINVDRLLEHIKSIDPVTQNEFKSVKLLNELGGIMRQKLKTHAATDQTKHIMATIANICLSGSAIFCRQKSNGAESISTKDMIDLAIKDSADNVVNTDHMKRPNLAHDVFLFYQNPQFGKHMKKKKYKRVYKYLAKADKNNVQHMADFLMLDPAVFVNSRYNFNSSVSKIVSFIDNHSYPFFSSIITVNYFDGDDTYGAHYIVAYDGRFDKIKKKRSNRNCIVLINYSRIVACTIKQFHQYCKRPKDNTILLAKKLYSVRLSELLPNLDDGAVQYGGQSGSGQIRGSAVNEPRSYDDARYTSTPVCTSLTAVSNVPSSSTDFVVHDPANGSRHVFPTETPSTSYYGQPDSQVIYRSSAPSKCDRTTYSQESITTQNTKPYMSLPAGLVAASTTFGANTTVEPQIQQRQRETAVNFEPISGSMQQNAEENRISSASYAGRGIETVKQVQTAPAAARNMENTTPNGHQFRKPEQKPQDIVTVMLIDELTRQIRDETQLDNRSPVSPVIETVKLAKTTPATMNFTQNPTHSNSVSVNVQNAPSDNPTNFLCNAKTESRAANGYSFLNNYKSAEWTASNQSPSVLAVDPPSTSKKQVQPFKESKTLQATNVSNGSQNVTAHGTRQTTTLDNARNATPLNQTLSRADGYGSKTGSGLPNADKITPIKMFETIYHVKPPHPVNPATQTSPIPKVMNAVESISQDLNGLQIRQNKKEARKQPSTRHSAMVPPNAISLAPPRAQSTILQQQKPEAQAAQNPPTQVPLSRPSTHQSHPKPKTVKTYNVVVVGASGAGKSSLLNSFYGIQRAQDFDKAKKLWLEPDFKCLLPGSIDIIRNGEPITIKFGEFDNKNENLADVGQSVTQRPMDYVIDYGDFKVRFVDTPGLGDTRGFTQDEHNIEYIQDHLLTLPDIHGFMFVVKNTETKLSMEFENALDALFGLLPKAALKNCSFVYTFTSANNFVPGSVHTPLSTYVNNFNKKHNVSELLLDDNQFCVDNDAVRELFVYRSGYCQVSALSQYRRSWDGSKKSIEEFLAHVKASKPISQRDLALTAKLRTLGKHLRTHVIRDTSSEVRRLMASVIEGPMNGVAIYCAKKKGDAVPLKKGEWKAAAKHFEDTVPDIAAIMNDIGDFLTLN
uniref:SET domain-containing protein n=1 Tax=Panagrellus redivivus TaxID=6233 RepID=A0A7E4W8N4_PANRE